MCRGAKYDFFLKQSLVGCVKGELVTLQQMCEEHYPTKRFLSNRETNGKYQAADLVTGQK